jgi:hypothetical protein
VLQLNLSTPLLFARRTFDGSLPKNKGKIQGRKRSEHRKEKVLDFDVEESFEYSGMAILYTKRGGHVKSIYKKRGG